MRFLVAPTMPGGPEQWPEGGEVETSGYAQLFGVPPADEGQRWRRDAPPKEALEKAEVVAGPGLTIQEDYGFDVKGYLHLRGLFSEEEVDAMAAGDTDVLVSHPGLNRYLDLLMGEGNSLQPETGEPCKLLDGEVTALAVPSAADDEAPLVGGSELRDPSRQWVSVEGHRFAQGVRVVAALSDAAPSPFALVPCSHKLNIEAPSALIQGGDDMARFGSPIVVRPTLAAGDAILCVSNIIHGVRHCGDAPPPSLLTCEFVGNVSRPGGAAAFSPEEDWMAELSEEERLVLGLPLDGNGGAGEVPRALLSDGETVSVGPPAAEYHPRLLAPVEDDAIDPDEQFFWELNGVSRHAYSAAQLRRASVATHTQAV